MDQTFLNRCRACTEVQNSPKKMMFLFEGNLSEMFMHCTSLQIAPNDNLPSHLCFECFGQLTNFDKFRQDCVNSDIYFRDQTVSESIKVETSFDVIDIKPDYDQLECNETDSTKNDIDFCTPTSSRNPLPSVLVHSKYICDYCGQHFDKKNTIASHMTKHKNEMLVDSRPKQYACTVDGCNKTFRTKKVLHNHRLKVHKIRSEPRVKVIVEKKVRLQCPQCPQRFEVEHKLGAHIRSKHEGLKPYKCPECDKECCKYRTYINHIKIVHTKTGERHKCTYDGCDKVYSLIDTLRRHVDRIHLGKVPDSGNRRFICDQCGQSFKTAFSLRKHYYTHTGIKPFACKICPKKFTCSDKLRIHVMRHENIRPFKCPTCGQGKTTLKELRHHLNFHSKEITYPCKECPRVFASYSAIGRHVRIHHRNHKPYICPHCQRAFSKAETMKNHIMTHTGEKPFACSICGHRFIQAVALRAHMKVHTKSN